MTSSIDESLPLTLQVEPGTCESDDIALNEESGRISSDDLCPVEKKPRRGISIEVAGSNNSPE